MEALKKAFQKIRENIYEYSKLNDALFEPYDFDSWDLMLRKRSERIREIYKENEEARAVIYSYLDKDFDYDVAKVTFYSLKQLKDEEVHDSGLIIPIMERLILFYEKLGKKEALIFLYLNYGYEAMEYYLRMGNMDYYKKVKDAFLRVISFKEYYKEFNPKARARIFIGYYNLTSALPDLLLDEEFDSIPYYREMLDFYFSKEIQDFDKDNMEARDEVIYVVEAFCYGFGKYIWPGSKNRDEFFSLVEESYERFDDLSSDVLRVIEIILGYYHKEYDEVVLFSKLNEMNQEYLDMNLTFLGTEDSILDFCNWMDVSASLTDLIKNMNMQPLEKKNYIKGINKPILEYIARVKYKDYTSYFDDVSSDLFRGMLPYMENMDEKLDLIQRLIIRRQPITYIHSLMVKRISEEIVFSVLKRNKEILNPLYDLGMGGADIIDYIGIGAMIHDLGKCLTVGVINAQGRKLTDDEFNCVKLHPKRCLDFLNGDKDFDSFYDIMLGHHKWYDGSKGYPLDFDNTKSKYKIAIDIISIADSIDAATDILGRNYTIGKDFDTLLKELVLGAGTRYNPDIVKIIESDEVLKEKLRYLTKEGRGMVYYLAYKEIASN